MAGAPGVAYPQTLTSCEELEGCLALTSLPRCGPAGDAEGLLATSLRLSRAGLRAGGATLRSAPEAAH